MNSDQIKPLFWVASSKKDLQAMPCKIQDSFGYGFFLAQIGDMPSLAKPLKGFGSAGVLELYDNWQGNTYRAVYTVKLNNAIYVLHCFQKKSTRGICTPKPDIDLINERLHALKQSLSRKMQ